LPNTKTIKTTKTKILRGRKRGGASDPYLARQKLATASVVTDEGDTAIMTRRIALRDNLFVDGQPPSFVSKNRETGEIPYPPQTADPVVRAADEPVDVDGVGTLLNFTRVLRGIPGLNTSFAIGLIRLDGGPVLTAPLVDWENSDLRSGARVSLVIGEIKRDASGNVFVGPKFRPAC
jgi:uncharacterized OB-fold protein